MSGREPFMCELPNSACALNLSLACVNVNIILRKECFTSETLHIGFTINTHIIKITAERTVRLDQAVQSLQT